MPAGYLPNGQPIPGNPSSATQGWSAFLKWLQTHSGQAAKWNGKWYTWQNGKAVPASQTTGSSGGGGGSYGGGGGGGGGGESEAKALQKQFARYVHDLGYMNLSSADKKLIAKAVKGKWDMAQFDMQYRRTLTKRYLQSEKGRDDTAALRKVAGQWDPKILAGGKMDPHLKAWVWDFTKKGIAPTATNFEAYFVKTKFYKENYKKLGYEKALDEYRNPVAFRQTTELFKQLWRQTFNEEPPVDKDGNDIGVRTFFSHRIKLEDFKGNAEALAMGADPFQWANQGEGLSKDETHGLLFGEKGGEAAKQRLARAYNLRKSVFENQSAQFGASKDEQDQFTQAGLI
jgi:hypothetical protein